MDPLTGLAALLDEAFNVGAKISDDGALHLRMADDLAVSVAASPDRQDLVFYSVLADLTRGRTVATLMTALSLNLHQEATRGGHSLLIPAPRLWCSLGGCPSDRLR